MMYPILDIFVQYGGAVATGLLAGLFAKAFFARQMHDKIRGYQSEIVKSHSRILSLEATNDKLEQRIKELEGRFSKEPLYMN